MDRTNKRKIPDWRAHVAPVFRDVEPGRVPLKIGVDGEVWMETDIKAELVASVETIARGKRRTFGHTFCKLVAAGVRLKLGFD